MATETVRCVYSSLFIGMLILLAAPNRIEADNGCKQLILDSMIDLDFKVIRHSGGHVVVRQGRHVTIISDGSERMYMAVDVFRENVHMGELNVGVDKCQQEMNRKPMADWILKTSFNMQTRFILVPSNYENGKPARITILWRRY